MSRTKLLQKYMTIFTFLSLISSFAFVPRTDAYFSPLVRTAFSFSNPYFLPLYGYGFPSPFLYPSPPVYRLATLASPGLSPMLSPLSPYRTSFALTTAVPLTATIAPTATAFPIATLPIPLPIPLSTTLTYSIASPSLTSAIPTALSIPVTVTITLLPINPISATPIQLP